MTAEQSISDSVKALGLPAPMFARLQGYKVLLTGRIRPADKDTMVTEYLPRMAAGSRSKGREMLYVVATQTIEVGTDLDFAYGIAVLREA